MDDVDPSIARETKVNPVRNVVAVGLLRQGARILLVRTNRLPGHWQPIGGGVKSCDSSPQSALLRELREEVGLALDPSALRFEMAAPYDFGEGQVTFFSADVEDDVRLDFDDVELAEWKWCALSEALTLPTFPATRTFVEHLLSRIRT